MITAKRGTAAVNIQFWVWDVRFKQLERKGTVCCLGERAWNWKFSVVRT